MTKLASIERITEIKDIEGADKIQGARILGYWTVIKKGEFQVGDLACWHNPDCVVDLTNPAYSFLKGDGRLRVRKFKKQVSQGLALPVAYFNVDDFLTEGQDVTEIVGIKKYEKPIPAQLAGTIKGSLPSWLKRTDEERLLNYPDVINEFKGRLCVLTKKYDGSSVTFYLKNGEFGVCSRNLDLKEDDNNAFWKMAKKFKVKEALEDFALKYTKVPNNALQAELIGPGVNGNHVGLEELSIRAFNIFNIDNYKYGSNALLMEFCIDYNIPFADVVWANRFNFTLDDLVKMANETEYSPGLPCEGLVLRPIEELESETLGGRLSVKIISEKYALKNGE